MKEVVPCDRHTGNRKCLVMDLGGVTKEDSEIASRFIDTYLSPHEIVTEKSGSDYQSHLVFNTDAEVCGLSGHYGELSNVNFGKFDGDLLFVTKNEPSEPYSDITQRTSPFKIGEGTLFLKDPNGGWASASKDVTGYMIPGVGDYEEDDDDEGILHVGQLSFQFCREGGSSLTEDAKNTCSDRAVFLMELNGLHLWGSRSTGLMSCEDDVPQEGENTASTS